VCEGVCVWEYRSSKQQNRAIALGAVVCTLSIQSEPEILVQGRVFAFN
jgi:hypothetical protein